MSISSTSPAEKLTPCRWLEPLSVSAYSGIGDIIIIIKTTLPVPQTVPKLERTAGVSRGIKLADSSRGLVLRVTLGHFPPKFPHGEICGPGHLCRAFGSSYSNGLILFCLDCLTGMRHLCWIWFSLWAQILLPNLSPIPPEQQEHGTLSDLALRNLPGRKWGHAGALKTWRRIRFWKTYFSYDSEAHATSFHRKCLSSFTYWCRMLNYLIAKQPSLSFHRDLSYWHPLKYWIQKSF